MRPFQVIVRKLLVTSSILLVCKKCKNVSFEDAKSIQAKERWVTEIICRGKYTNTNPSRITGSSVSGDKAGFKL